jgi:hypothetical protein
MFATGNMLYGPTEIISSLPQAAWVIAIGICFNFYAGGQFAVLALSETINGVKEQMMDSEGTDQGFNLIKE